MGRAMDELERAKTLYEQQYRIDWHNRAYSWHPRNLVSLIHAHELETDLVMGLNQLDIELVDQEILDVGCGYGRMLRFWAEMGANPHLLHGLDLSLYRLERGHELSPIMGLTLGSAGALPFPDQFFSLVSQFSMFSSIHDTSIQRAAAIEMGRVLKPGGWLVWYDIAFSQVGNVIPLARQQVLDLFPEFRVRYEQPIFSTLLTNLIRGNPRLAIILEQLPIFHRAGLILILQKLAL
jgi:ubiquinone/menaquinone biosynthesis C-methylase UbiE